MAKKVSENRAAALVKYFFNKGSFKMLIQKVCAFALKVLNLPSIHLVRFNEGLQALMLLFITSGPQRPQRSLVLVAWPLWCSWPGRDKLCPSPSVPHLCCLSSVRRGRTERAGLWCLTESGSSPGSAVIKSELRQGM